MNLDCSVSFFQGDWPTTKDYGGGKNITTIVQGTMLEMEERAQI